MGEKLLEWIKWNKPLIVAFVVGFIVGAVIAGLAA